MTFFQTESGENFTIKPKQDSASFAEVNNISVIMVKLQKLSYLLYLAS